ncbi:retinol dehydrogenase 11-like [Epargyreus clarus]|uniref:retinol dehydrogenase 11-like n=1 Tax=Epargyreus clarus TaxID=520877 RepID=UPI003C2B7CB0
MFITIVLFNVFLVSCVWVFCKLTSGICKCSRHLVGKVAIVTGGNTGIGFETAKDLAERGARVILACRNEDRGTTAQNKIRNATGNNDVHFMKLDLASLSSVRAFVENITRTENRLDILINNAGINGSDIVKTGDGLVEGMQINHFGPFLLTYLLLPLLKNSAPSRIINVSSEAHYRAKLDIEDLNMDKKVEKTKSKYEMYSNSKLCNILMTTELSRKLEGTEVTCNALHPGVVNTDILEQIDVPIFKYVLPLVRSFFKTPWEGAQTSIYLAVSPDVKDVSGAYFRDCHIGSCSKEARDSELARKLWEKSVELVGLK